MVTTASIIVSCLSQTSHPMWERKEGIQAVGSDYTSGKGDQTEGTTGPRQGFLSFFFFFTNQKGKGSYLCGVIVVNFEKLAHYTLVLLVAF